MFHIMSITYAQSNSLGGNTGAESAVYDCLNLLELCTHRVLPSHDYGVESITLDIWDRRGISP